MYRYDYENDILLLLRILKYLHQYSKKSFHILLGGDPEFDWDYLYDVTGDLLGDIFPDFEIDWDEEYGTDIITLSHPVLDKFLSLSSEWSGISGTPFHSRKKKLENLIDFFVVEAGYSVLGNKCAFADNSVRIMLWMSPDCYEPLLFLNSLISLLIYIQEETAHLENLIAGKMWENRKGAERRFEKEAA